jgi:hypothetical protein
MDRRPASWVSPVRKPFLTAIITLEPLGKSTPYTAVAMHRDETQRKRHEEMRFLDGWVKLLISL